jgi:hypothetical protein
MKNALYRRILGQSPEDHTYVEELVGTPPDVEFTGSQSLWYAVGAGIGK